MRYNVGVWVEIDTEKTLCERHGEGRHFVSMCDVRHVDSDRGRARGRVFISSLTDELVRTLEV